MYQLSISAACAYVRKAMDELVSVEEIGMLVSPDAVDIHKLVEGAIVEAAVRVHKAAPAVLLDGVICSSQEQDENICSVSFDDEGRVATIKMAVECIRIASIRASSSDIVVCDLIPEDSAEGRKQLNRYIRGTYDDPRVVLNKVWAGNHKPVLTYYCTKDENDTFIIEYVPYPAIEETIVQICPRLEYAVLNEIVAMVLDSLGESEKSALYRAKSKESMEG